MKLQAVVIYTSQIPAMLANESLALAAHLHPLLAVTCFSGLPAKLLMLKLPFFFQSK